MVFIWPVGVPVFFASLLFASRKAITERKPTTLSRAIRFLHAEYRAEFFFWELSTMHVQVQSSSGTGYHLRVKSLQEDGGFITDSAHSQLSAFIVSHC